MKHLADNLVYLTNKILTNYINHNHKRSLICDLE